MPNDLFYGVFFEFDSPLSPTGLQNSLHVSCAPFVLAEMKGRYF